MCFLSLCQPAIAACWCGSSISLLWVLLVQVATCTPQTTGRLPTVSPDVANVLAVMILHKASLRRIHLHLDGNVPKAWQIEDFLQLYRPGQGYKEQGELPSCCFVGTLMVCIPLCIIKQMLTQLCLLSISNLLLCRLP
jgi:hypothetical protein